MNNKSIAFLFLFLSCFISTEGQTVRSFSNDFLNIGIGARQLALGKASSSFTTGVESGYWNPAGVITVQDIELAGMHNDLFAGIGSYDYIAVALPIERDELAFAISVIRLGVDNILNTTQLIDDAGNINLNNITTFNTADIAAYLTIAKSFKTIPNLRVGASVKIIRRNIGDFALGHGFGFDVGAQYKIGNFNLGLTIRDVTTTFTAWDVDDSIYDDIANAQTLDTGQNTEKPESIEITLPKFQLGASTLFRLNDVYTLLTSVDILGYFQETNDLVSNSFASFTPSAGLEIGYNKSAFLRLGVGNIQKSVDFDNETSTTFEPNIGVGIIYKNIYLDYALTNVGASSGVNYSNIFSLKIKLNELR